MKKIFLLFLSVLFSSSLFAQNFFIIRSENAKEGDIRVSELSADVRITGNIASTTVDLIIENNSSVNMEGELEFPLSENQYITGYALDINGKLRKGVVVEKEKARVAFEEKVRQNIDPGLVEKTQGNNFKTRVYPLPPKGSRHVQITYEEEIPVTLKNGKDNRNYVFPPIVKSKLDKITLNVNIYNQNKKPEVSFGRGNVIDVSAWNSGYNLNFSRKNFEMKDSFVIDLPLTEEKSGLIAEDQGRNTCFYFYTPIETKTAKKAAVKNLGVFWDVSSSAENRNIEKELQLLKDYIGEQVSKKVEVVLFSNDIVDSKVFDASDWKSIEKFINGADYDGATYFNCVNYEKGKISHDEALVFSDGIENWGQMGQSKFSNIPLSVVSSSVSADYGFLKQLARNGKGSFVNLLTCSNSQALELLKNESLRLINVEYDNKSIKDVFPAVGTEVNGSFSMSGIMLKRNGKIKLSFGYGNKITQEIDVEISSEWDRLIWNDTSDKYVTRLWAQKKIEELSIDYEKNSEEILELSKKYGIVTKNTSLLVLETVNDYIRYGIEPPEELRKEWQTLFTGNSKINSKADFDRVVKNFEVFKKWWNTKPEEFKKSVPKIDDGRVFRQAAGTEMLIEDFAEPMLMEDSIVREEAEMAFAANASVPALAKSTKSGGDKKSPSINLQAWNPDADYISALKRCSQNQMYKKYLELKTVYKDSPSFYMDVADYFWEEEKFDYAIRILSNLAEMKLENTDILRGLGNKLVQMGQTNLTGQTGQTNLYNHALNIFQTLTKLRPEVPLFYRDLGLAYARVGKYQEACDALYHVAEGAWDSRYDEIQQIALNDMNAIIDRHKKEVNTKKYDKRVLENFPVDIRIVLTWNTDDCDIDLWVTDPNKEKCYYGHKLTELGGHNSRDFTRGYGPEEFCLKSAKKGKYTIQADYYGTRSQKILQPVVVQAEVYTNFGKKNQKCEILTLQLKTVKGNYVVGTIDF